MKNLIAALANAGIKPPIGIPGSFESCTNNVGDLIRILELPDPEINRWNRTHINFDEKWTHEFQGITSAFDLGYGIWFFSNRDTLYKVQWDPASDKIKILKSFSRRTILPVDHHHFGDIDYYKGILFVPLQSRFDYIDPVVLAFSPDLEYIGGAYLYGKSDILSTGWCAINPLNSLLYISDDTASFFYVYDISALYDLAKSSHLWHAFPKIKLLPKRFYLRKADGSIDTLGRCMQGVDFTHNGRIYISQAIPDTTWGIETFENYLACYNSLTGTRLGYMKVEPPDSTEVGEESQGITYCRETNEIYLALLDNDHFGIPARDEIDILRFSHPNHYPL
jgi:hypothetical protein